MKILVVGGGGREHAIAKCCAASAQVVNVFVAPGNAGTASGNPKITNVDIAAEDIAQLSVFAQERAIDLTIVGPEGPLVAGISDRFDALGLPCFGPRSAAAMLEGSKTFAKEFMAKHKIPTAASASFSDASAALEYIALQRYPLVVKADGLAAGKGVVIANNRTEAESAITAMLSGNRFGEAGHRVVVEDFMSGEEASFICIVSGEQVIPMASSQDHKAAYDGDQGPNTGGMGAYSPAPVVDDAMQEKIMETVIHPTVRGLQKDGIHYLGFLYAGLMIGEDKVPRVVEFNCRFGDPEAQPVLSRLKSDLFSHCLAAVEGRLDAESVEWDRRSCLGVVLAARGYPDSVEKGSQITGLAEQIPDTDIFHAGTRSAGNQVLTDGGRVLCATGFGDSVSEASARAYERAALIHWDGCWYRKDIGYRAIAREQSQS